MTDLLKLRQYTISSIILYLCVSCCHGHKDPAYMSQASDGFTKRTDWMSQLPDNAQLSELALPGTHGSASYLGQPTNDAVHDFNAKFKIFPPFSYISSPIVSGVSANQGLNIEQQLQFGIRAFDIRILYKDDEFGIMQGGRFLHIMFTDFLNQVVNFLIQNPTETVLFALKIEQEVGKNKKNANDRLKDYLKESTVSKHYLNTKNVKTKLEEARGKFIILSRDTFFNKKGLVFYGKNFNVMDNSHLNTNWDLYKKWTLVKNHLELARKGDNNLVYVTYLSGYGGTFPYFVASGHFSTKSTSPRVPTGLTTPLFAYSYPDFPRVGCVFGVCQIVFEGINVLTRNIIQSYNKDISNQPRTVGIIMADFPGDSLIANIIENNYAIIK